MQSTFVYNSKQIIQEFVRDFQEFQKTHIYQDLKKTFKFEIFEIFLKSHAVMHKFCLFRCDSSSICANVGPSVCQSVGQSVGLSVINDFQEVY